MSQVTKVNCDLCGNGKKLNTFSHAFTLFILILTNFLITPCTFAQPVTSSTSATPAVRKKIKSWGLAASISSSRSLYDRKDGSLQSSLDYTFNPSYKINNDYKISAYLDASQDLKNSENNDLGSGKISVSRSPFNLGKTNHKLGLSVNTGLPVSKASKNASLLFSVGGAAIYSVSPDILTNGLGINLSAGLNRNVHQYDTAISGRVNTAYSSTQSLGLDYSLTDSLSLSLSLSHINAISYERTMKDYYAHSQELGVQATEQVAFILGHQYGGPYVSTLAPSGDDYRFNFTDEDNSYVYFGINITL